MDHPPVHFLEYLEGDKALRCQIADDYPGAGPRGRTVALTSIPRSALAADMFRVSKREVEVLELLSRGFNYSEIGKLLAITINTVRTFVRRIYSKLHVHSRSEAVFEAHRAGILRR